MTATRVPFRKVWRRLVTLWHYTHYPFFVFLWEGWTCAFCAHKVFARQQIGSPARRVSGPTVVLKAALVVFSCKRCSRHAVYDYSQSLAST